MKVTHDSLEWVSSWQSLKIQLWESYLSDQTTRHRVVSNSKHHTRMGNPKQISLDHHTIRASQQERHSKPLYISNKERNPLNFVHLKVAIHLITHMQLRGSNPCLHNKSNGTILMSWNHKYPNQKELKRWPPNPYRLVPFYLRSHCKKIMER